MRIYKLAAVVAVVTISTFSGASAYVGAAPVGIDVDGRSCAPNLVPEGTVRGTASGRMQCIGGKWVKCEYHGTSCGIFGPISSALVRTTSISG